MRVPYLVDIPPLCCAASNCFVYNFTMVLAASMSHIYLAIVLFISMVISALLTATCDVLSNATFLSRKARIIVSLSSNTLSVCQLEEIGLRGSTRSTRGTHSNTSILMKLSITFCIVFLTRKM